MTRASMAISSVPPSRKKRRSCSTRSRSICSLGEMSPISSRKMVPDPASSNLPRLRAKAPVKAPRSCPNSSDSSRVSARAAQDSPTNGSPARPPAWWMARAMSSLPVPLAPWISTVLRWLATSRISSKIACIRGFLLMMSWNE